jgi:ketosteroid isomerase-like protein
MMREVIIGAAAAAITVTLTAQPAIPADLAAMADTERAFAKSATVKGWRDAFLEFFADDAIAFTPAVTSAKDRLRQQPSTPFTEFALIWEPRTGDVSASGDLGWLTGPSTSINHKSATRTPRYGCYLSVWRKQPDGRWRVFIDVGADAPDAVSFPPGLTRTTTTSHYTGNDGPAAAGRSLRDADRALNAQITELGPPRAFAPRLTELSRLHRSGSVPLVGPARIRQWLDANATAGSAADVAAEAAAAGDFGYSHGTFEVTAPARAAGAYVRLWSRDAAGTWWLMADVAQEFKR